MQATAELTDSPTAWFAILERAKRTGNVEMAMEATENLRRLGVRVYFRQPENGGENDE